MIFLISASQVARIIGVSHQLLAKVSLFKEAIYLDWVYPAKPA
jgi:hypothetical protein